MTSIIGFIVIVAICLAFIWGRRAGYLARKMETEDELIRSTIAENRAAIPSPYATCHRCGLPLRGLACMDRDGVTMRGCPQL